jgi:hypothetical protein
LAVARSTQHVVPPVHGVAGHSPLTPPLELPLLLPLELPLEEPLEDPLEEPLEDPLEEPLEDPLELPLPPPELPPPLPDEVLPLELPDPPPLLPLGPETGLELPLHAIQTSAHAATAAVPNENETDAREAMGNPPGCGVQPSTVRRNRTLGTARHDASHRRVVQGERHVASPLQ